MADKGKCAICGIEFDRKPEWKKYCSPQHAAQARMYRYWEKKLKNGHQKQLVK